MTHASTRYTSPATNFATNPTAEPQPSWRRVSANQQALNAGIRQYKAAFAKALKDMPTLLQTTSATPNLPGPAQPGHHGRHGGTAKPSPSHS